MSAIISTSLRNLARGANVARLELVLGHARFAMDRAAAHSEDPSRFPLPPATESLERMFATSLAKLSNAARRRIAREARKHLDASPAERTARYGVIGGKSPTQPVDSLVELKAAVSQDRYRITPVELDRGPVEVPPPRQASPGTSAAKPSHRFGARLRPPRAVLGGLATSLELIARTITCVSDTRELGKDEIALAGIRQEARIDADSGSVSNARSIAGPFGLGKFKTGDSRAIGQVLASFDLDNTPKLCTFDLFLAETDVLKGFEKELREALNFVPDRFDEVLGSVTIGGLLTGAAPLIFPGSWPFYLVLLIIVASILLANAIWIVLRDDVFPPHQVGVPLTAADFLFPGDARETAPETVSFSKFGGTYNLEFQWRLV